MGGTQVSPLRFASVEMTILPGCGQAGRTFFPPTSFRQGSGSERRSLHWRFASVEMTPFCLDAGKRVEPFSHPLKPNAA